MVCMLPQASGTPDENRITRMFREDPPPAEADGDGDGVFAATRQENPEWRGNDV